MDLTVPLSEVAEQVLRLAHTHVERLQHSYIDIEHLLLAMIQVHDQTRGGVVQRFFRSAAHREVVQYINSFSVKKLNDYISRRHDARPTDLKRSTNDLSTDAVFALRLAADEVNWMDQNELNSGHLLLGILRLARGRALQEGLAGGRYATVIRDLRRDLFVMSMQSMRTNRKQARYTRSAKLSMSFAQNEALELRHDHVNTAHLLLGILQERQGMAARVLRNLGINAEGLRGRLLQMQSSLSSGIEVLGLSPNYKRLLERAGNERHLRKHERLSTGHMLYHIVFLDEDDVGVRALRRCDVRQEEILQTLRQYVEPQLRLLEGVEGASNSDQRVLYTLTFEAQRNIEVAMEEAMRLGHRVIDTAHLVMALMIDETSLTSHIFSSMEADRRRIRALMEVSNQQDLRQHLQPRQLSDDLQQTIRLAIDVACDACDYAVVNPLHLLVALLMQSDTSALEVLQRLPIDVDRLRASAIAHLERIRT